MTEEKQKRASELWAKEEEKAKRWLAKAEQQRLAKAEVKWVEDKRLAAAEKQRAE